MPPTIAPAMSTPIWVTGMLPVAGAAALGDVDPVAVALFAAEPIDLVALPMADWRELKADEAPAGKDSPEGRTEGMEKPSWEVMEAMAAGSVGMAVMPEGSKLARSLGMPSKPLVASLTMELTSTEGSAVVSLFEI